MKQVKMKL